MKEHFKNITFIVLFLSFVFTISFVLSSYTGNKEVKIILPNDWKLISKYEGDPSLLNAYIRNDSIILNFEGY
jgi:hypothetical protein